jgi:hypothetical protein
MILWEWIPELSYDVSELEIQNPCITGCLIANANIIFLGVVKSNKYGHIFLVIYYCYI